jgi:hypothetical protein
VLVLRLLALAFALALFALEAFVDFVDDFLVAVFFAAAPVAILPPNYMTLRAMFNLFISLYYNFTKK